MDGWMDGCLDGLYSILFYPIRMRYFSCIMHTELEVSR